jgi:CBS domain-containing protein
MTQCPEVVTPDDSITAAAEVMHYTDDAFVPVVRDKAHPVLVGVITARDIVVRCIARHHPLTCRVRDHMTPMPLHTLSPYDDIHDVARLMCDWEVRRIPVVTADGVLAGVVHDPDLRRALDRLEAPVPTFADREPGFLSQPPV